MQIETAHFSSGHNPPPQAQSLPVFANLSDDFVSRRRQARGAWRRVRLRDLHANLRRHLRPMHHAPHQLGAPWRKAQGPVELSLGPWCCISPPHLPRMSRGYQIPNERPTGQKLKTRPSQRERGKPVVGVWTLYFIIHKFVCYLCIFIYLVYSFICFFVYFVFVLYIYFIWRILQMWAV